MIIGYNNDINNKNHNHIYKESSQDIYNVITIIEFIMTMVMIMIMFVVKMIIKMTII